MKDFKSKTPTLGDQIEVIRVWWKTIEDQYIEEYNFYEKDINKHLDK